MAHLRIKRLARLGRDSELLRMAGLAERRRGEATRAGQGRRTCGHLHQYVGRTRSNTGDLPAARQDLIEAGTLVPALLSGSLPGSAQKLSRAGARGVDP